MWSRKSQVLDLREWVWGREIGGHDGSFRPDKVMGIGSRDPAIKSNFSSPALDLDLDLLLTTPSSGLSRIVAAAKSGGDCEPKVAGCNRISRSLFETSSPPPPPAAFVVALHKDDEEIGNQKHFNWTIVERCHDTICLYVISLVENYACGSFDKPDL